MSPVWRDTVLSLIRHLLTALAGILVAKGWIDSDLGHRIVDEGGLEILSAVILFAGTVWMAYREKIRAWFRTITAHKADPSQSLAQVLSQAKRATPAVKQRTVEKELTKEALDAKP